MYKEILQSIKESENLSEKIIITAEKEAKDILTNASQNAYKLSEQTINNAEKEAKSIIQKAKEQVKGEEEKINHQTNKESTDIILNARKRFDIAIETILGRIVKCHGDY